MRVAPSIPSASQRICKEDIMAEYWDRERGRRYRGEGYDAGYYGSPERDREREYDRRGGDRGFFDRAGDEVRSWFGDEEAQRRRVRDERESRAEDRERGWGGARADEEGEREWARQWGYVEGRGARGAGERAARGWGYSGGYGAGPGFAGGRSEWTLGGGYEPGGWTGQARYGRGSFLGRDAMAGPYAGRGPRGYQRSDERIREDVCERMCDCGELNASDIEVRVSNGEVTLQGTVRDRQDKRLAEDLADQVSGVREVHNQIRVSQPGSEAGQAPPSPQQRYRIA
jgi:osmotically-inducible protein OsmY